MRTVFQIIKAFAIVLAVMIVVSIVGAVVTGVRSLGLLGNEYVSEHTVMEADYADEIQELDINVKATELRIEEIDSHSQIRVETTSEYVDQWQDGDTLRVTERSHGIFGWNAASITTIYLPKNTHFQTIRLEVGAGTLTVATSLNTEKAILDFGAGRAVIEDLYVSDQAKIETGAGLFEVHGGKIKDLDLEMGAGKATINSRLVGDSHIQTGAGKLELNLIGDEGDYTVLVHKGIGNVTFDGESMKDDERRGTGTNQVEIESGVGAVEIEVKSGKSND